MKNYVKPAIVSEGLAESVYMASGGASLGEGSCWEVSARSVQDWSGVEGHVYEITANHVNTVHISSAVEYIFTFTQNLVSARSEGFPCSFEGNTVHVTRELHANAYTTTDNVTFKLWASTGDEATTKALPAPSCSYNCTKTVNVQGGMD